MGGYPRRLTLVVVGLGAAAVLLAACGNGAGAAPDPGDSVMAPAAIATSSVAGLGTVLVDSAGKTLYYTDQDTAGVVHCTGTCLDSWFPAMAAGTTLPPGSVAGLSVIRRPDDGREQFAYQGRPLYEFKLDGMAGQINGNEAHDRFGGTSFRWHAAVVAGTSVVPSNADGIPGY
jgi:predicted lipoprotein with Yx(FWY)xxD motif